MLVRHMYFYWQYYGTLQISEDTEEVILYSILVSVNFHSTVRFFKLLTSYTELLLYWLNQLQVTDPCSGLLRPELPGRLT